jgi:hypothetical protein
MGGDLWGGTAYPYNLNPFRTEEDLDLEAPTPPEERDVVLRSGHELTKYRLVSGGETFGYIEDLLVETNTWSVLALQFDTRKWFHGDTLRLAPGRISRISWKEHLVEVENVRAEEGRSSGTPASADENTNTQVHALFGIRT